MALPLALPRAPTMPPWRVQISGAGSCSSAVSDPLFPPFWPALPGSLRSPCTASQCPAGKSCWRSSLGKTKPSGEGSRVGTCLHRSLFPPGIWETERGGILGWRQSQPEFPLIPLGFFHRPLPLQLSLSGRARPWRGAFTDHLPVPC